MHVLVLDSLFDSLSVEREVAARYGATLERWNGGPATLAEADVVAHVRTRIDAELIAAMRSCRVISRFGSGLDTVDLDAARDAGIEVVAVRDYCIPELSSHTLALAFSLLRRLRELAWAERRWEEVAAESPLARHGTAAVIGMGSIGTRVAAALSAIGYDVLAVTAHGSAAAADVGAAAVPLDEALAAAQIVFLHASLRPETHGLIDERRLHLLRPETILVNTARLGLLDDDAVAAALDEQRLGGLALDAVLPASSLLRRFADDPRVIVTPHIGWYSEQSAATLRANTISNALELLVRHHQPEASPR